MHRKFYSIGSRLEASIFLFVLCCVVYLDSLLLKVRRIVFETSHKILVVIQFTDTEVCATRSVLVFKCCTFWL